LTQPDEIFFNPRKIILKNLSFLGEIFPHPEMAYLTLAAKKLSGPIHVKNIWPSLSQKLLKMFSIPKWK